MCQFLKFFVEESDGVGQSTVLLKNVVPVEGTASCVFVKRKRNGLTASGRHRPKRESSGVAYHFTKNVYLSFFIDL